jgi:hypothetical protein
MQPQRQILRVTPEMIERAEQTKYETEMQEMELKRKELYETVKADQQNTKTLTIKYMQRRVTEILFKFKEQFTDGSSSLAFNMNQEDLQVYRLVEIKVQWPFMKILFIPKDEKEPEQSRNINLDVCKIEDFAMTYVDHCTDCMSPRDKTTSI